MAKDFSFRLTSLYLPGHYVYQYSVGLIGYKNTLAENETFPPKKTSSSPITYIGNCPGFTARKTRRNRNMTAKLE